MNTIKNVLLLLSIWLFFQEQVASNYVIEKKGVNYVFVPFDEATDFFVNHRFANWENETFDVFESVKDLSGVAIDLGAWIGTTAIWCAKNFSHVVAVDADRTSLQCLRNNLAASDCSNVTICERPIAHTAETFVFGPRGSTLNESISYIKETINNPNDYTVQGMTFKQLIHDFVYENDQIQNKKISFIKCDIEGGEETILEDVLYFAYHNNVKVYMSFHISWWVQKSISDFESLFKFFKTNCPTNDLVKYLRDNPFASILFEPLEGAGTLVKKDMPVVVIGYNQLTYIKNMVSQLEKYTSDIILVDNHSTYEPLLDYYRNEFKYTLLRQRTNHGHRVFMDDRIQNLVGTFYIITDPDLQFNSNLPHNFIDVLLEISKHFNAYKVGFALFIDSDQIRTDVFYDNCTIQDWEKRFWMHRLDYPLDQRLELYNAQIDTTFCLINKSGLKGTHVRVAGDYTCLHLPWFKNFKDLFLPGEYEASLKNNISTSWLRQPSNE